MSDPLVSIILTSFNQPEFLEIAFKSLLEQTYKNIEIIIVDDCSTNPLNKELILKFHTENQERVQYYFQKKNVGIAKNKNYGFKMAKGDFITFLDGDDFYFPEKIESEMKVFKSNMALDAVYSDFVYTEPSGKTISSWATSSMPEGDVFEQTVEETFPDGISYRFELAKRTVYEKFNFYDESLAIYHDWDFRIRYTPSSKVGFNYKIASAYRRSDTSISVRSSMEKLISERKRLILKNIKLIGTYEKLNGFVERFFLKCDKDLLFDQHISKIVHIKRCVNFLIKHPFKIIYVLRSFRFYYYIRKRENH